MLEEQAVKEGKHVQHQREDGDDSGNGENYDMGKLGWEMMR